jgi:hypothetical protein
MITTSNATDELDAALFAAQAEFPEMKKEVDNPFFKSKYADLPSILRVVRPILRANGLLIRYHPTIGAGGEPTLTTVLWHTSGQWIATEMLLMLDKNNPQGQGSAITYARRYSMSALLDLVVDADDDGNAASSAPPKTTTRREPPKQQPAPAPVSADLDEDF